MGLSEPLGAGEWEKHGGEIKLMKHPGGRTSVLYFSPDGHKFRSWKQCLIWIGEQLPVNLGNRISSGSKRPGSDDDLESPPLKKKQKKSNGISSQKQDTDAVHVSSFPAETPTDGGRKKSKPKKTQKNSDGSLSPRRSRDAGDGSSSSEEGLTDGGRKKSKLKNEQRNSDGGRPQGRGGDAVELSLFSDEGRTNGGKGNSKRLRKKNSGSALASASGSGSPSSPESKEQRTIDKSLSSSNFTRKATQELVKQYCNPPEEGPTDGGRKKSKPKNDQRNSDGSPPQRRDGDAVELSSFSDEGRTNGGKGNSKRLRKKNSGSGLASGSGSGSPTSPGSKDQRASGTSLSPSTFTREATQELVKQCYNPPASEPAKVGRLLSTSSHENGRGARSVTHQGNLFAHEDHEIISPASLPCKGSSSLASPLRSRGQEKSDVSLEQPFPSGVSNGHSTDYVNLSCKIDKTECSGDDSDGSDFELSSGVSRELKSPAGRLAAGIRPKRAAAQKNLKEKDIDLCEQDARILLKRESIAETEETAVSQSNCDLDIGDSIQRDLHDFCIRDYGGRPCPVELYKETDVYVSGVMYPRLEGGGLEKVYDGVRCDNIGPVTDWFLMGYEDCQPLLGVSTDVADYYCQKPAPQYKKFGTEFLKKCKLCLEVYDCFAREGPGLTLDRLLSQLSQSFNKQGPKGSFYSRRFFEGHRMFVVEHLLKLEFFILKKGDADGENRQKEERVLFIDTRVWKELACFGGSVQGQGVGSSSDAISQDERLAWALQEEDDRADVIPSKRAPASKGKYYVKINETEIAVDYPLPAYYKKEEHETDEFLLNNDDDVWDPKDLPMRKLHDWTLYNTDSRLVPLELVPMLEAEADTEVFGSGVVTEEDGGDFCIDGAEGARGGLENGESSSLMLSNDQEMRVSLSAIKEWKVELGYSGDFISLRTERAWYRLGAPSRQYLNWYQPVVKTAGLAREIITMLTAEHRINRLSFKDVIKRLSEQSKEQPTYISGKLAEVERYIVVHGPILWQIFAEYPIESIRRSSFISGLSKLMEQVSHTKLSWSKKFSKGSSKRSSNLNPCAKISPDSTKRKPMRATTTRLVDNIWKSYYAGNEDREAGVEKDVEVVELVEDELAEESDDEEPVVEIRSSFRDTPKKKKYWKSSSGDVELDGLLAGRTGSNERVFKKAISRGVEFTVGTAVQVHLDDDAPKEHSPVILLIEYIYETKSEGPKIHGRILQKGAETILGNAANEREVFLTDACEDIEVEKIISKVTVEMRKRNWGHKFRTENAEKDMVDKAAAAEREKKGLAQEYFCRSWYSPERGAFFSIPKDSLSLGNGSCKACEMRRETGARVDVQLLGQNDAFRFEGVTYQVGDYLYVDPYTFNCKVSTSKALHKAGRNKGLRAFTICHLLSICSPKGGKRGAFLMKVRRFYRPEDVDVLKAYRADIHEVYYSEETSLVDMAAARGKCVVRRHAASMKSTADDVLFCNCIYDSKSGALSELPGNIKLSPEVAVGAARRNLEAEEMAAREKGKGKAPEYEAPHERLTEPTLSTLDIFAGCGGLAEGLHQSGVATTKWALEYDHLASEAFKLNHPTAKVFCNNCNVILRAIMEAGGDLDDCVSTPEADELSRKLDVEMKLSLPKPGEVDFISGGPPCQGFSGMNRFNQRAWSKVQCEMILSFLSYVEYLRPRFFLLENVRNFVSFNKGQTFRLSLMTLLEMGYQVRFGVLQAGNYGVAQSRKRAFIWAVAPDEALPEWPQPRHVFASSQLGITFPGGVQYSAVKDAGRGAPFRPITVRDTIGDLPPVGNGANKEELLYTNHPESWFQKVIRGECVQLVDHISKEMNELNLIRCQRIPKEPGQDWRALPSEKVTLSTGQVVDLIPWCLPNTADRHNQWKGLFGRLDWDGNFPTSVTDPQPMGKVGMCFHPDQDRIVTVRECARSQGFPDYYKFFGNAISKHRQIGNAVPPPLARALGYMLKEAIKRRQQEASS